MAFTFSGVNINGSLQAAYIPPPSTPYYLWSWGRNSTGQLGLGNTTNYSSPKQVGTSITWSNVSSGNNGHSLALKTDGSLWAWGSNGYGRLGLGDTTSRSSPTQVGALTNWSTISAGGGFGLSAAIKTDGTLWTWGYNGYSGGNLGLGNTTNYSSPKQVGALTNWLKVSASNYGCMAIKTDGTLWGWGHNGLGKLGLGDTTSRNSPVQVGSLTNWSTISVKGNSGAAIKTDGTLWTWGYNSSGQLGDGTAINKSSPVQVGSLTNWSAVSVAEQQTMYAIKTNGTLWAWGSNGQTQLGLSTYSDYSSPKQVGALTTWAKVSGGGFSGAAIKTDGTLWAWGYNSYGVLGLGDTNTRSSPTQVGALTKWEIISMGYPFTNAITNS